MVAQTILEWAAKDDSDKANTPYTPPGGEELWKPTPPKFAPAAVPYWKNNRRMVSGCNEKVFGTIPPVYSSPVNSEFYKMAKEVFDVSQQLTEDQKSMAWFWDDSPNGKFLTVSGHWSSILHKS